MTSRGDAILQVQRQCQTSVDPVLENDEVAALVDASARYTVWQAAFAYTVGALVAPATRNGHLYRCLVAGTSGSTEPVWPLFSNPDDRIGVTQPYWGGYNSPLPGSSTIDGTTLLWMEAGLDDGEQYDTRAAVYEGWLLKAAKASTRYDGALDGDTYRRSQVYQQCVDMAQRFLPMEIA